MSHAKPFSTLTSDSDARLDLQVYKPFERFQSKIWAQYALPRINNKSGQRSLPLAASQQTRWKTILSLQLISSYHNIQHNLRCVNNCPFIFSQNKWKHMSMSAFFACFCAIFLKIWQQSKLYLIIVIKLPFIHNLLIVVLFCCETDCSRITITGVLVTWSFLYTVEKKLVCSF